ncbi:MAG: capsule biosynthesis protein [Paracoccaceae bacterium]
MTTNSNPSRYRLKQDGSAMRKPETKTPPDGDEAAIEAIRAEGLTGRQLRMARRVAERNGIEAEDDYVAIHLLRQRGIDPFDRANILALATSQPPATVGKAPGQAPGQATGDAPPAGMPPRPGPGKAALPAPAGAPQGGAQNLPVKAQTAQVPSTQVAGPDDRAAAMAAATAKRAEEIGRIQRDIARRRRLKLAMLLVRLSIFVFLPTAIAGYYFSTLATPMYETKSEFTVRQAESQGGGGLGSLFQGTGMATQQDATGVQSYLQSRDAMVRLDADHGFKEHFSQPGIDALQRLPEGATNEEAFDLYSQRVKIGYDPTEGILKLSVVAADPETSRIFSEALIEYAEERVDQQTTRLRADQMAGALSAYEEAEARRQTALQDWLSIQEREASIDPVGETAAFTQQIAQLETERQRFQLELQTRLNARRPNQAQVNALEDQIGAIDGMIEAMRTEVTSAQAGQTSIASRNTELRLAEENYGFQTLLVQQALQQMESARIEADRQITYLSLNVQPVAPDQATYPRVFENTIMAFLVFAGIYLMISLTASILREQVTS